MYRKTQACSSVSLHKNSDFRTRGLLVHSAMKAIERLAKMLERTENISQHNLIKYKLKINLITSVLGQKSKM